MDDETVTNEPIPPQRKDDELHIPLNYAEVVGLVRVSRSKNGRVCNIYRLPPVPFPLVLGRDDGIEQTFYVILHPDRPLINKKQTLVVKVLRMEEKRVSWPAVPEDRGTR